MAVIGSISTFSALIIKKNQDQMRDRAEHKHVNKEQQAECPKRNFLALNIC